ncbi:GNAT family N-acetyltransferase [Desulfoluna butyratoxydans]|uniref:Acyl-coa n-acyltransferase n=1 Tax=Desulfoluna butyratoxydans TaxID=231438 RepID=A0A4U8YWH8_9BACT|nr:GNAT family N-acetyltransferase [Desulfoluna butyratoxydans]VFQ45783.1 acyl-coa n-acyltransferase [Desulfoluna butyratoxydans]
MITIDTVTDPRTCRSLWEHCTPNDSFFDLWPVRWAFAHHFKHPLCFIHARDGHKTLGFLPLCHEPEADRYVYFPGETWGGKTWLEQNRITADSHTVWQAMLESAPGEVNLNYLLPPSITGLLPLIHKDDTGYLFYPGTSGFHVENHLRGFSTKSLKNMAKELSGFARRGLTLHLDRFEDLDTLFSMNRERFGASSYFSDPRFLNAFKSLATWLKIQGLLRVVTLCVEGNIAAVDMAALWKDQYVVLAGGTHPDYPGIAKAINLYHMDWACRTHLREVDFLCGDFNWKERFHLTPRPLYALSSLRKEDLQKREPLSA